MSSEPRVDPNDCLWPLAAREAAAARLADAAALGPLGPESRFELAYADVAPQLGARARAAVPALLRVGEGAGAWLAVVGYQGGEARLVRPDGTVARADAGALARMLRAPVDTRAGGGLAAAVARAGIAAPRAAAVTDALLVAAMGGERIAEGTRLHRARPSLRAALQGAGVARLAGAAFAGYFAQLGLVAALWWLVGARAVAAHDGGVAGMFLALTALLVLVRLLSSWVAGRVAIDGGQVLRERLLHGLLALDSESIRTAGIGQLLGRVVETEQLESLALGGGLVAAAGLFELATGAVALAAGAAAWVQLPLLAVWLAGAVAIGGGLQRALARWSARRVALTHDLVERMAGQRTLVIQQPPALRHREEDAALAAYAADGRVLDRWGALLAGFVARGWLLAGVVALAPSLASATLRPGLFAISLGGVLFVYGGLRKLAQAFPALSAARIAWRQVADMLGGVSEPSRPSTVAERPRPLGGDRLKEISARGLSFTYPGRNQPVLSDLSLTIAAGDRILLEGPSGGGKSTLGALLAGLRAPDTGALTLDGIDRAALGGARWRTRVGAAPQFHENHVFSASLMFNLLMGRAWPPRREDVAEAEALLRELDLGPLLARMPSGMEQLVGDSGWQLSHGERSRLYIARSLLQPLDARVLDESFAALDPETLERALACVLRRAETLIVIAHP